MEFAPLTDEMIADAPEWMRAIELRADGWRGPETRAFVGREGSDMVAVGVMWTSRVHDSRYWVEIVVDPARRRRGLGTAMFRGLSARRHRPIPFTARGYIDSTQVAFARSLGATVVQTVPPATIRTANYARLRAQPDVMAATSIAVQQLAAAQAAFYDWTHASWSPVATDFAGALNESLEHELDFDATSLIVDEHGEPLAMTLVWNETPPVITGETMREDVPGGERLIEACLNRSLAVLHERGIDTAEMDGHVTDPHLAPVWSRLGAEGTDFIILEIPGRVNRFRQREQYLM